MASILAAAEYALMCEGDEDANETTRGALLEIVQQSVRCGRIVRSVLQFSRNEQTEKWPVNINESLAHACHLIASFAHERSAQVDRELTEAPTWVEMNSVEMEQVFVNLIRNGIQSKPEGANVRITTRRTDSTVEVRIQDNGAGIPEAHQSRIFDPFFTTRVQNGGTGLGLSVAHGIVMEHGGEIDLESNAVHGTTVCIRLPAYEGPDSATQDPLGALQPPLA